MSRKCDKFFILLQDKEQPAFHDSEFPALGGVLRSANVGIPNGDRPGSLDGSNMYAHIGTHKGLLPSEFNIQSEEFPALPGATGREADGRQADQQSTNPANQVGPPAIFDCYTSQILCFAFFSLTCQLPHTTPQFCLCRGG